MEPSRPPLGALGSVNNHALPQGEAQSDWEPSALELDQLRSWLDVRPDGMLTLEMLQPDDPDLGPKAKRLMERDGYVRQPQSAAGPPGSRDPHARLWLICR